MFALSGKTLVVLSLILATGLHWAALQTVAWTSMLANNLRGNSLSTAVEKTFDGRHPCPLCKAIAAAKQNEKKSDSVAPALKLEFPPVVTRFMFIAPEPVSAFSLAELSAAASSLKPPLPPPRGFFA